VPHARYDTYTLANIAQALGYLRESQASAALISIVNASVEFLKQPSRRSLHDLVAYRNRHAEAAALAALGRLGIKQAEPALTELLIHLPVHSYPADSDGDSGNISPVAGQNFIDLQDAILAIRGEKAAAKFELYRGFLRLHDSQLRRYQTDIEYGGRERWASDAATASRGL
jgi:hypothetical protein